MQTGARHHLLSTLATAASRAADRPQRSLELAIAAAHIARDNRAQDVVVLDLRELTPEFDFFVIATGTSRRQQHAVAEEIDRIFTDQFGEKRLGLEGYASGSWILLDYGDVVVHLFDPDAREFYALEDLWTGSSQVDWQAEQPKIAAS